MLSMTENLNIPNEENNSQSKLASSTFNAEMSMVPSDKTGVASVPKSAVPKLGKGTNQTNPIMIQNNVSIAERRG